MTEAPTLWLIVYSHRYDGWNGYEWSEEDAQSSADRGYFTSKEDAQAWINAEKQQRVDAARAKNDAALAAKNAEAERKYNEKVEQERVRRREYDAIVYAGLEPSFARPPERDPFTAAASKFDEQVFLKALNVEQDWEIVEMEPAREAVSHG